MGSIHDANEPSVPPTSLPGLPHPPQATSKHWTPETVISTLSEPPQTESSSPLPFLHVIERLKTTKREGWRRFDINHGESIADHMYRMSIITMLCPPSLAARIDVGRCTHMALLHDMAESLVGDITPVDGVSKTEKSRRETETMDYLCTRLLGNFHGGEAGRRLRALWQEYEDNETLEAQFVHDVDKMELLLQMVEYERSRHGGIDLGEFAYVATVMKLPEVRDWANDVLAERDAYWTRLGKTPGDGRDVRNTARDEYYGNGVPADDPGT